ncbi:MAG: hypothetical protein K6A70_04130 [Erysipelotrichaceae bacterium]|nr:hypothetical protein [Erysipelotrichaceae bacterium]
MEEFFRDILLEQGRVFKHAIMRDYLIFEKEYTDLSGFAFLETVSKEYEIQKFFEIRLEHYIREILVNGVFRLALEDKGVGVYMPELNLYNGMTHYYTNVEYENIAKYEFIADYGKSRIMYRYTETPDGTDKAGGDDFADELVIIKWDALSRVDGENNGEADSAIRIISLLEFFQENSLDENYNDYISFITGIIVEFQEFIGAKSIPKLSPCSMGFFRFKVEEEIIAYVDRIKEYIVDDEKIRRMNVNGVKGLSYGYQIIDDENRNKFSLLESKTNALISNAGIVEDFINSGAIQYLIGGKDYSRSLITSEYLLKQYDCDDCFDYTAIASGYLKSVEQLIFHIVSLSANKGLRIKSNGNRMPNGEYPSSSKKEGKVYKIDLTTENLDYVDSTIGALIHFINDNKEALLVVDEAYRETIIDALNCYRIECRNNSFHRHNNYSWSRVELIRKNTFFMYLLLLSCCKLGDTQCETNKELTIITDSRLERLYYLISSGYDGVFDFVVDDAGLGEGIIRVKHTANESEFPSFDSIGRIKSAYFTFESIDDGQKVIITNNNAPREIWYEDSSGRKRQIL